MNNQKTLLNTLFSIYIMSNPSFGAEQYFDNIYEDTSKFIEEEFANWDKEILKKAIDDFLSNECPEKHPGRTIKECKDVLYKIKGIRFREKLEQ